MRIQKRERGVIREVVIVLVALVALKYFWNIDVIGYIEVPVEKALDWLVQKWK